MTKIKLTIEVEGQDKPVVWEYDHFHLAQELGVKYIEDPDNPGNTIAENTDHNRAVLQLWSGFEKWDDFKTDSGKLLHNMSIETVESCIKKRARVEESG